MTPLAIGTPITFYWNNNQIAGLIAQAKIDTENIYYTLALFQVDNNAVYYYHNARHTTDKTQGTFEVVGASA